MTTTIRKASITAGISLLIMTIAAIFAFGFVFTSVVSNDISLTIKNIQESTLFQTGLLGWGLIIITDIIVTWAFFVVLKPINLKLAALSSLLRAIYTLFLAVAVSHLFILNASISSINELQVSNHLKAFNTVWSFGLIIFGFHLLFVGLVVVQNNQKILGVLLEVAGLSYTLVHILKLVLPVATLTSSLESILVLPMTIGELGFGLWLLFKGGKISK